MPDSEALRRRVAEKVGAGGADTYSLLAAIDLSGEVSGEAAIEKLLKGLSQTPLGLTGDDDFRISVAGAEEKSWVLEVMTRQKRTAEQAVGCGCNACLHLGGRRWSRRLHRGHNHQI